MKKNLLIVGLISGATSLGQVVSDQVSAQPGYTNQVYYSLENGEVSNITNQDWNLAFDLGGFGTGIRVNGQGQTKVYVASNDTSDWTNLDTSGMSTWGTLYNSDLSWTNGALNMNFDPSDPNDIGWGIYNSITHQIIGNKIFVLEMPDGSVKKLWIESLINGAYNFRIANLDNTDDFSQNVNKISYPEKNMVYYSASSNTIIDREPSSSDWDIVFTKYMSEVAPNSHYAVTGALTNKFTKVYEATGDNVEDLAFDNTYPFETDINVIGYDWKTFSFSTGSYIITDSTAYFIKTAQGDFWKVVMTGFGGSANGDIMFTKERIGTASVEENNGVRFTVYPNPTTGLFRIKSQEILETIAVYNYEGQLLFISSDEVLNTTEISLEDLPNGIYFLQTMSESGQIATQKIVKI